MAHVVRSHTGTCLPIDELLAHRYYNLNTIPKSFDYILKKKIKYKKKYSFLFGDGKSDKKFYNALNTKKFWKTSTIKEFNILK